MYYIVVDGKVYEFLSRSRAEKFYFEKDAEGCDLFATQDENLAKLFATNA